MRVISNVGNIFVGVMKCADKMQSKNGIVTSMFVHYVVCALCYVLM